MRIALIYTPTIPLPPNNYGGVERILTVLINGLSVFKTRKRKVDSYGDYYKIEVVVFAPKGTSFDKQNIEIVDVPQGWGSDNKVFEIFIRYYRK